MVFEALVGQRRVKVTTRWTAVDFAHLLQELVNEQYPQAEQIVLVLDNLNTHKPAQTTSQFPFRWCGMKPTVSGISQLDGPPRPHNARTEALNALESRYVNPQGYADPTQSTYVRTGVNKIVTRFGHEGS